VPPCSAEVNRMHDAKDALDDAARDRADAQEAYDDAGGVLDDSSFWDVAVAAGAAAACLSTPFSWVVCGVAIVGGGAGVAASETSRHDEIEAAEQALERADQQFWRANDRFLDRAEDALDCLGHELSKIQIP
jgi:hypothetical protein